MAKVKKRQPKKVGNNLKDLPKTKRRAIWRMRKQAQTKQVCPPGKEAHHPNYNKPSKVVCVTRAQHEKMKHKW